eukprot:5382761-Lingulodinium_polyedra.AAC.1
MGPRKARRLDSTFLAAVGAAAGERALGRTGGQVADYLATARRWTFHRLSKRSGNATVVSR